MHGAFPLQKGVQILHRLPLFHYAFVASAGVGSFHHTGIGVPQQISTQSGTPIFFLYVQLSERFFDCFMQKNFPFVLHQKRLCGA